MGHPLKQSIAAKLYAIFALLAMAGVLFAVAGFTGALTASASLGWLGCIVLVAATLGGHHGVPFACPAACGDHECHGRGVRRRGGHRSAPGAARRDRSAGALDRGVPDGDPA